MYNNDIFLEGYYDALIDKEIALNENNSGKSKQALRKEVDKLTQENKSLAKKNKIKNIALGTAGAGALLYGGAKAISGIHYREYVKNHGDNPVSYKQWVADGKPVKEAYADGYYAALKDIDVLEEAYNDEY